MPDDIRLVMWHQVFSIVTAQFGKLVINMQISIKQKRTISRDAVISCINLKMFLIFVR